MMKPLLLAPLAFVGLASAAPPPIPMPLSDGAASYPPCSATVIDRCIQGRGRHHRHSDGQAYAPQPEPTPMPAPMQMSGGDYPPCTAELQDRCQQGIRAAAPTRYARFDRERIRIGERG